MPTTNRISVPSGVTCTAISANATGDFVSPSASTKKLRVVGLWLIPAAAAVALTFKFGSTNQTGAMTIPTTGIYLPPVPVSGGGNADFMALWSGAAGEAFGATFGAGTAVAGCVWTVEENP